MKHLIILGLYLFPVSVSFAQKNLLRGKIYSDTLSIPNATVQFKGSHLKTKSDQNGYFELPFSSKENTEIQIKCMGYEVFTKSMNLHQKDTLIQFSLRPWVQEMDEIMVTGVSSATKINENPIAIQKVTRAQIDNTSESNIMDALVKYTPGLQAVKTGPNISKPFIRGLGYNRVLTLFDGIRQEGQQWGDEHGLEIDGYEIQKAEIIKGPASLMFGSDALAGVVSLIPFYPQHTTEQWLGKFNSEFQSNHGLTGNGLRLYRKNEHFFINMSASLRTAKNYQNAIDGRVYLTNFNEKNAAVMGGYTSKNMTSRIGITYYTNQQGIPDGSRTEGSRKFTKQIFEADADILNERPLVSHKELNSYQIPVLSQDIQHLRTYLQNEFQFQNHKFKSLIAYQNNIRKEFNHPTQVQQAGMNVRLQSLNYALQYQIKPFKNMEQSIGMNGMLQKNTNQNATDFPIPDYDFNEIGFFYFNHWKSQKWTLSGGIRYDQRNIQWSDFYTDTNPKTGFGTRIQTPKSSSELPFPAFKKTYQGWSYSLGSTYQIHEHLSLKANIGSAYRAPNINEIASNGLDPGARIIYLGNRSFNPEFSVQEDVGLLGNFTNYSFEMNVFHNQIQNYIYQNLRTNTDGSILTDAQGNRTYQYQQAKAQLFGIEGNFNFHPKKWKYLATQHQMAMVYGYNRNPEFKGKGGNGEFLPLIPAFQISNRVSYQFFPKTKLMKTLSPQLEIEYTAAQNRYLALNQSETFTPSYTLVHCSTQAQLHIMNRNVQALFSVNNVFNTVYQSHLSRLKYLENTPQLRGRSGIYNMGRNIGVKFSMDF